MSKGNRNTYTVTQSSPNAPSLSGNPTLCSEQSGKTQARRGGNQKENDLEIQGDQMVALLGAEAAGLGGMKARSVLGLTDQVRRGTQRESEHSGLEEPSHRQRKTFRGHPTLLP